MSTFSSIRAVAFDAFGTLIHLQRPVRPLAPVMQWMRANNLPAHPDPFAPFMRTSFNLAAIAPGLPDQVIAEVHSRIATEIASLKAYDDALPALHALKRAGLKIALCSNLLEPYAPAIISALPHAWDAAVWSFEAGALKPDPQIFAQLCRSLACDPHEILFVGDDLEQDYLGALAGGLQSLWLRREHHCQAPCREIPNLAVLPSRIGVTHAF